MPLKCQTCTNYKFEVNFCQTNKVHEIMGPGQFNKIVPKTPYFDVFTFYFRLVKVK